MRRCRSFFFQAMRATLTRQKGSLSMDGNVPGRINTDTNKKNVCDSYDHFPFLTISRHPLSRLIQRRYLRSRERDKGSFAVRCVLGARARGTTSLVLFLITGEGDDYLTISLRDGGAAVGMTLAKGRLDLHIKPARVRFDDHQWHKIIVHRKVQEVTIIILSVHPRINDEMSVK